MAAIDAEHARWLDEGVAITDRLVPLRAQASAGSVEIDLDSLQGPEDYVRVALLRSPVLRTAELRVRRLEQRVPQARSLDDPMLMVTPIGEMADTATGRVGLMTSLSQKLPLPAKRDARGRIAEEMAAEARANLQQARVELAANVRRAYWSHALAVRTIETIGQSRSLLVQFRDVADVQYRSGTRSQQDVLRAAAELGTVDTQLARLAQQRDSAAAMLRRLLVLPADRAIPEPSRVERHHHAADRDRLLECAARTNPALHALAERADQYEARQELAALNRWPDLTISLSYNSVGRTGLAPSKTGDDQWWIGFGINLPIWHEKLDAADREAMFGRLEAASAMAAEHDRVVFDVEDAVLRLGSQEEVLRLLRMQVIPDTRAAVEASTNAYRTGTGDFLGLLDNWRQLLAQEVLEHQVVAGIEHALADLAQAVGDDSLDTSTPDETQADVNQPAKQDGEGEAQ